MLGLSSLQKVVHPHTTLDKILFIVENLWRAHEATATVAFAALAALVLLRMAKRRMRWIRRMPEVLVVVVTATGSSCRGNLKRMLMAS
jgi:carbon starvation protein CstA